MSRVGQNCIYALYMTVHLVISLPELPCIHCIYMVLANPVHIVHHKLKNARIPAHKIVSLNAHRPAHKVVSLNAHRLTCA
jgi:hypothetical protein